jgi:gamma-glutamylaminecyclotransferase
VKRVAPPPPPAAAVAAAASAPVDTLLFVYGTLKRGFQWHSKFLSRAVFVATAESAELLPLVVGDSGVPYLLGDLPDQGCRVRGELFRVCAVDMLGLDEYEGCGKGYYERRVLPVVDAEGRRVEAHAFVKCASSADLRARPFLSEYSLDFHRQHYRAIRHIGVKQDLYMHEAGSQSQS